MGRAGFLSFTENFRDPNSWSTNSGKTAWEPMPDSYFEDPFLYYDAKGRYHAIVHNMNPHETRYCGAHAFSADGVNWTYGGLAYNNTVTFLDGEEMVPTRRERPHLIFDKDKTTILGLSTSASGFGQYGDGTFTLVQPVATMHRHSP